MSDVDVVFPFDIAVDIREVVVFPFDNLDEVRFPFTRSGGSGRTHSWKDSEWVLGDFGFPWWSRCCFWWWKTFRKYDKVWWSQCCLWRWKIFSEYEKVYQVWSLWSCPLFLLRPSVPGIKFFKTLYHTIIPLKLRYTSPSPCYPHHIIFYLGRKSSCLLLPSLSLTSTEDPQKLWLAATWKSFISFQMTLVMWLWI